MTQKLDKVIDRFIKNTPRKGYVKDLRINVGNLAQKVKSKIKPPNLKVYVTTKSLKHMYDQRSAQEFDFVINNLTKVTSHPHRIYKNKEGKTGDFCFYHESLSNFYFYIFEVNKNGVYLVSAYRLSSLEEKRKNYLSGYKLLWSWKVDLPSS